MMDALNVNINVNQSVLTVSKESALPVIHLVGNSKIKFVNQNVVMELKLFKLNNVMMEMTLHLMDVINVRSLARLNV